MLHAFVTIWPINKPNPHFHAENLAVQTQFLVEPGFYITEF